MTEPLDPDLEQGIHADPDDDARFLVYADWLTAHGNPRGELASIQLAREHGDSPELAAREAELLGEHAEQFRGRHRTKYTQWLDDLCISHYKAGFWRSLSYSGSADELRLILNHPSARLLHTLQIQNIAESSENYDVAISTMAAANPRPLGLRELRIGDLPEGQTALAGFGDRTCSNLGELADTYPQLATLRLLCPNFGFAESRAEFASLRWLDARIGASPESLAQLARTRLPGLEQLDLGFETIPQIDAMYESLHWPDDALDELLATLDLAMPALRRLRLFPLPYTLDHPLIQRLADMPRITICDMDTEDDGDGVYVL